jgi:hypothetical protein
MIRGSAGFLLGACVFWVLGCGARTSTLEVESELAGQDPGGAAGAPTGGSPSGGAGIGGAPAFGAGFGGSPSGGAGYGGSLGGSPFAGAGFGGALAGFGGSLGGAPVGGAAGFAAGAGVGAFGGFAASAGFGVAGSAGSGGFAGSAGFGAAGSAGFAGSGGASVIVDTCTALAGSACQQCQCLTCSSQLVSCFSEAGCPLILACAQRTGCQGFGCYSPATCQPTIDQFGGLAGSAVRKVFALATCSATSQMACGC